MDFVVPAGEPGGGNHERLPSRGAANRRYKRRATGSHTFATRERYQRRYSRRYFEARKSAHHAHPGHVSFGEHTIKLNTLAVESFGRLGWNCEELLEQVTTSVVVGEEGVGKRRKGVLMELIEQVISITAQVAIFTRVRGY